jgi:hypothetical protein
LKPFKTIGKVLAAKTPLETKELANALMITFYKLIFERVPLAKIQEAFNARGLPLFAEATLLSGFFHHVLCLDRGDAELLKLVDHRIRGSRVAPGVAYRYGQYLAVLHFPHVLKYRLDEMEPHVPGAHRRQGPVRLAPRQLQGAQGAGARVRARAPARLAAVQGR